MYALMALLFIAGYLCIALEHPLKVDKAASALITAVKRKNRYEEK